MAIWKAIQKAYAEGVMLKEVTKVSSRGTGGFNYPYFQIHRISI